MEITVIKKKDGKVDRKSGLLVNRLRVVAYARVSTDSEEQLNSYESQKSYYKEKIMSNPEWSFVDIYADEAISGTQDYKRTQFMKMIDDGLREKYDLIITKSISRFARNTVDTLKYVRLLKEQNIAVFFEEENINTLEMSGELLLTILSSVAQQESETISSHVKLGLKMKSERGELVGFNNCYGYSYDSKTNTFTIIDDEADIVKLIFKKYLEGIGCSLIAKELTKMNLKSPRGHDKWNESTVRGIIRNEKYKGDVLQGKTFTTDPISHKRLKNLGESDQYYMKEHHEAIISVEDFDKAQEILAARCGNRSCGRKLGYADGKFVFSSIIRCGFCGSVYTRRAMYSKNHNVPIWICMLAPTAGKANCPNSKSFRDTLIKKAFLDGYHLLCNTNSVDLDKLFDEVIEAVKASTFEDKVEQLKQKETNIIQRQSKLLDLMVDGTIDKATYTNKLESYNKKLDKCRKELSGYELLSESEGRLENSINKVKKMLKSKNILDEFDDEVFHTLIENIIIGGYIDGKKEECMIRFICKTKFNCFSAMKLTKEKVLENNDIVDAETKDYVPIIDFYSMQKYNAFITNDDGEKVRVTKDKIRVRFEIERT